MTKIDAKPGDVWVTRAGGRMRVYATDGSIEYPIHGAYETPKGWISSTWTADGRYLDFKDESGYDLIRKYDWRAELAPIWAVLKPEYRWVAMDENGGWYAYIEKPNQMPFQWRAVSHGPPLSGFLLPTPDCDWTETLTERPEESK